MYFLFSANIFKVDGIYILESQLPTKLSTLQKSTNQEHT